MYMQYDFMREILLFDLKRENFCSPALLPFLVNSALTLPDTDWQRALSQAGGLGIGRRMVVGEADDMS